VRGLERGREVEIELEQSPVLVADGEGGEGAGGERGIGGGDGGVRSGIELSRGEREGEEEG